MRIALLVSALLVAVWAVPAEAQTYGSGKEANVPWIEPGTITVDGQMDEAAWMNAADVDALANWDGAWSGHPEADVGAETKLLYTDDTLFVFHRIADYAVLFEPAGADHVLLGLDVVHQAGVTDTLTDPGFAGFPDNAPDQGPFVYKIFAGNDSVPAFSINFSTDIAPSDSGWVDGQFFFDEQTLEWGFEAAIVAGQIDVGGAIGFNIGGGQAKEEGLDDRGEATYAFYSWAVCDPETQENTFWCGAGGTIMSDAHSYGTLNLLGPNPDVYGTGAEVDVPWVDAGSITLDGQIDESAWASAGQVDAIAQWDGAWSGHPDADVGAETRILYTEDSLFVYHKISDYAVLFDPPGADHVLLGLDFVHQAGITDVQVDQGFGGFVENAPDGPFTYKIFDGTEGVPPFSLNFSDSIAPSDSGWVDGQFFFDEETLEWGFEAVFVHENVNAGGAVGFNIGGGQAKEEGLDDRGEATYAFYSWQVCDPEQQPTSFWCGAGGTIMSDSRSFGTLNLVAPAAGADYGTGVAVTVPRVDPGTIKLDGQAMESIWDGALTVDATAEWDGAWSGHPDPDVGAETRLLYTDDSLFVFHKISDYDVLFEPAGADHVLLGLDFRYEAGVTDTLTDPGFGGFVENAPDGPFVYKIFAGNDSVPAFSLNFSDSIAPSDSGWVDGQFFFDEETLEWGFEAAFVHSAIGQGGAIGFNIGGGQAKVEGIDDRGEATYAFYSWQVCDPNVQPNTFWCGAGGTIMSDAHSFATLSFGSAVAIEQVPSDEIPATYELSQNYPNPFNPSTTIEFAISQAGSVTLDVFNVLGQRVTTLVDGPKAAGTYRVVWEAGNLSSGVYVYQLRVDDRLVSSRKMVLLK